MAQGHKLHTNRRVGISEQCRLTRDLYGAIFPCTDLEITNNALVIVCFLILYTFPPYLMHVKFPSLVFHKASINRELITSKASLMSKTTRINKLAYIMSLILLGGCVAEDANVTVVSDGTEVVTADLEFLGERLFNDTNLSSPTGQSCASCHNETTGFDDPNNSQPTSLGADGISVGTRNSPTASYAAHTPEPSTVTRAGPGGAPVQVLIGGLFLDGRAATLEEQAKGPFLNPAEMANASEADVIESIRASDYAEDFELLFGEGILDEVDRSYDYVADSIAAFERTALFSPFTAKFDQVAENTAIFTEAEARGQDLFNGKAQCNRCHVSNAETVVFSEFEYHNIGVPSNMLLAAFIADPGFIDNGLGDVTGDVRDNGRFRTPNLRNIAITAPYMHNGIFTSLTDVIQFYNTRDTTFPQPPEVMQNLDQGGDIGELNLTVNEVADVVAFLETLTDVP